MSAVEVADAIILLGFVTGLLLAVARLTWRLNSYSQRKLPWPRLAVRDIIVFGGLLLPFLLILMARALEVQSLVADLVLWRIITGVPALISVWTLVWYEWAVIERQDRR